MSHRSEMVIGVDLGNLSSRYCSLDPRTGEMREGSFEMSLDSVISHFEPLLRCQVVFEVGGHSRWMKRELERLGFTTLVVDPRRLELLTKSQRKNDRNDARLLAQMSTSTPCMLFSVEHRDDEKQRDLSVTKARAALVEARTKLINTVRGIAKSFGTPVRSCDARCFHRRRDDIPNALQSSLGPLFNTIESLTVAIRSFDREIERLCEEAYPETVAMRQIRGVGPLTALVFVLTLADCKRFDRSRTAAAFIGLVPAQNESGAKKMDLGITKAGDRTLRCLLVQSAHYILSRHGEDSDLKRWGEQIMKRHGGRRKKAAIALARKLAVVLHRIWATDSDYRRFRDPVTAAA